MRCRRFVAALVGLGLMGSFLIGGAFPTNAAVVGSHVACPETDEWEFADPLDLAAAFDADWSFDWDRFGCTRVEVETSTTPINEFMILASGSGTQTGQYTGTCVLALLGNGQVHVLLGGSVEVKVNASTSSTAVAEETKIGINVPEPLPCAQKTATGVGVLVNQTGVLL